MDNPQLVDYIRSQLAAGHTDAAIRDHLIKNGWPAGAVAKAFDHYHRSRVQTVPKARATKRPRKRNAWRTVSRVLGVVLVLAVIAGLALFIHSLMNRPVNPTPPVNHDLSSSQRQSLDVITLGGAVGQYVAANSNTLPTHVSVGPGGSSVVLCGNTCDPTTWQVSALRAYQPAAVKIIPFSTGVAAPNQDTLYLVSGARCKGGKPYGVGANGMSMVILYASQDTSSLEQHCVSL